MRAITDPALVPKGLELERLVVDRSGVMIFVSSVVPSTCCPECGRSFRRIHSRYSRKVTDLPWHGVPVTLRLRVRRFFCDEPSCKKGTFCERLPEVAAHARKTSRLEEALMLVAFELGGRAGARLAVELGLLVSRDVLLRRVRRSPLPAKLAENVRVLGVDDWALRKGARYGTILVDLERRRVVDLLPDRSAETLAEWLVEHPGVEIISRDRYRPYMEGASAGVPDAVQVADRFHIFKNLYDAVEKLVERNRKRLRGADEVPDATPPVESHPHSGHLGWGHRADPEKRRERLERYERVLELRERGLYVEDIAREVGLSQATVVSWLNAGGFPEQKRRKRKKPSPVEPYADYLERRWRERCINMAQLFREIKEMGYEGSYDAVADHLRCFRRGLLPPARMTAEEADGPPKGSRHECQETARLLMLEAKAPDALDTEQSEWLEQLRERCPELAAAQELAGRFARIMREGEEERLAGWFRAVEMSSLSEIRTFAKGVRQDEAAVRAAISLPWSSGQVEGQVNRLKLVKRQMYGRANFDLLRRRVLRAA